MIERAVCLHEEDNAVLWKQLMQTGAAARRMRRMVVSACQCRQLRVPDLLRFYQTEHRVRDPGHRLDGDYPPMESDDDSLYGTNRSKNLRAVPPALRDRQARPGH
jgi:hypothetical protein